MNRDFEIAALAEAMERGWGVKARSVVQLGGHAHSINFRVDADDVGTFAAKCLPAAKSASLTRLLAHTESARSHLSTTRLFGGRTLDFGGWKVLALKWIGGERRYPDELSDDEMDAFLSAHSEFLSGLVDDGEVLPIRDGLALKRGLLERLKGGNAPGIVRELKLMDDKALTLPPEKTRIIHGDLHWENFRFSDGAVSGFLDVEELRFGTPAEDFVRYVVCRAEHLRWHDFGGARRLLKAFAELVRRADSLSRGEWLFAIDGYLLRKLDKKISSRRVPLSVRLNLAFRFGFYRRLREVVYALKPAGRGDARTVVKVFGGTVRRFMGGADVDWGGRYRFTCDPACQDYDWLCVYDEIPKDWPELEHGRVRLRCPASHTMLLTQEPVSVKFYNSAYTRQFAVLLTNRPREAERHPGYVKGAGYMVWYTGRSFVEERGREVPEKTKGLSAVCSAKRMRHTEHANRFRLLELAQREIPGFDWFGKGVRPLKSKSDALDGYKYHVAFENHVGEGHWTEKVADALVCGCLPFYAGDPKLGDVLPEDCFVRIPVDDPAEAVAAMRRAMEGGEWERRRRAMAEARRLLFEKYNLFAQVAAAIESAPSSEVSQVVGGCVVSRRRTRLVPSAAFADVFHHIRRLLARKRKGSMP